MVSMSQRIAQLRAEKELSAKALSAKLKLSATSIDKFEAGKLTPSKDQQQAMAEFFAVSIAYLKGETEDRTRQDSWMDWAQDETPELTPPPVKKVEPTTAAQTNEGGVASAFLNAPSFALQIRDLVRKEIQSEGTRDMIRRMVKEEVIRQLRK